MDPTPGEAAAEVLAYTTVRDRARALIDRSRIWRRVITEIARTDCISEVEARSIVEEFIAEYVIQKGAET